MNRRGFLKLAGAAAAAVTALKVLPSGVIVYDEVPVAEPCKDWITDKGDWFEVVIPSGKTLRKENFDKPILLLMGEGAVFDSCAVLGFVNLYAKGNAAFMNSVVDATGKEMVGNRELIDVKAGHTALSGCHLHGMGGHAMPYYPVAGETIISSLIRGL